MRISRWAIVAFAMSATVPLQASLPGGGQRDSAGAALIVTEGVVQMNDQPVAVNAASVLLPDTAVLRTLQGRAAVALKRGGRLFLDANSSVRVQGNGVYNFNRIEVLTGTAIVASDTSSPIVSCESDVRLSSAGWFRFDVQPTTALDERPCEFRVYEGAAAVPLLTVTNALRAGQSMTCNRRCGDMIPTREFASGQLDEFDRWARRLR